MPTTRRRSAALVLGGVSLAASLGGCASTAADSGAGSTGGSSTADEGTTSVYSDGSYTATGDYQSPGGAESIDVELTLAAGEVTEVTVTGNASSGNAERYQTEFEDGIAEVVVGQNIDDISVDKVAGSSLTSDGFTDALDQIKSDAAA